mgnify:CR=1 FL=1
MSSSNIYDNLESRRKRCVCRQCGSPLETRMIIFCQYGGQGLELYCPKCERIEYGVEKEIYELADRFIDQNEFNYYLDMAEGERNLQLNRGKISELFAWLFREIHLLDKNGFILPNK